MLAFQLMAKNTSTYFYLRKKKRKWVFGSNDGWEICPVLGEGWRRKVVLRRSGMSVGQRDVYYLRYVNNFICQ